MSEDRVKAKGASVDPQRQRSECKAEPGAFHPVVDPRRCEGKRECVAACPYDVFEVGTMADETYRSLPFFVRLKVRAHGKLTAYTPRADACRACGRCVVACPERAIRLVGQAAG